MLEVSILLGLAETGSPLGLVLIAVVRSLSIGICLPLGLLFLYPLCLALLVGGGFGFGLGLGLRCLSGLLALYFGIFGGVPGVENLVHSVRLWGKRWWGIISTTKAERDGAGQIVRQKWTGRGRGGKKTYILLFLIVELAAGNHRRGRDTLLFVI